MKSSETSVNIGQTRRKTKNIKTHDTKMMSNTDLP